MGGGGGGQTFISNAILFSTRKKNTKLTETFYWQKKAIKNSTARHKKQKKLKHTLNEKKIDILNMKEMLCRKVTLESIEH